MRSDHDLFCSIVSLPGFVGLCSVDNEMSGARRK